MESSTKMDDKRAGRQLIGAIDQGTSSTRFLVFENGSGQLVASSQIEIKRIVPQEGWVEIDPNHIRETVLSTISNVHRQLVDSNQIGHLKCIGICNQRESVAVWDRVSGQPLYNVIVWMDDRTKDLVDQMIDSTPGRDFNWLKHKTGLPMSTYFSAFKLKWLIDNVDSVRLALKEKRLMFGTVDSWIIWMLTGQHLTDVTNASRTFLMDIESLEWNKYLCDYFNIPTWILPTILASADDFGAIQVEPLKGVPITGVIGDQSAALFGHNCLQLGQTKATFGTGCFIMQNIGAGPLSGALSGLRRDAKRGLITTVGYKIRDQPACYALEGSVKIAGAGITWLRDKLQLISSYEECDELINRTTNSAGVFFVPALGGLYAPYWDPNAAGLYIGLSQISGREHLVRATFDAIAFQTNEILSLMHSLSSGLMIDGGLCKSDNMCQILADITGCDIVRPSMCETSALGAALVAGCGAGICSYEHMFVKSSLPLESGYSAPNHHHHYPHESLNYESRFCSHIQSQHQGCAAIRAEVAESSCLNAAVDVNAGGGTPCEDAGGGLVDEELDSEASEAGSSSEDSLINDLCTSEDLKPQGASMGRLGTSSGYSSGDNFERASSSALSHRRQDSPFATICEPEPEPEPEPEQEKEPEQEVTRAYMAPKEAGEGATSFRLSMSNHLRDYFAQPRTQTREVGSPTINTGNDSRLGKSVDVFQSYISLEHRTDLLNSWSRAVERSMQWTKIHHEEVKRIDYQRLSSLPISLYLFFSVGMVALSGLVSLKQGGAFWGP